MNFLPFVFGIVSWFSLTLFSLTWLDQVFNNSEGIPDELNKRHAKGM